MLKLLDRLLNRSPTDDRRADDDDPPECVERLRREYQNEKRAALEAQIELLARVRRLGYDVDLAARKTERTDDRMQGAG